MAAHEIDIDGRVIAGVSNSADGEVGQATVFTYHQDGDVIWCHFQKLPALVTAPARRVQLTVESRSFSTRVH